LGILKKSLKRWKEEKELEGTGEKREGKEKKGEKEMKVTSWRFCDDHHKMPI
jgi:hypothetical protein